MHANRSQEEKKRNDHGRHRLLASQKKKKKRTVLKWITVNMTYFMIEPHLFSCSGSFLTAIPLFFHMHKYFDACFCLLFNQTLARSYKANAAALAHTHTYLSEHCASAINFRL